MELYDDCLKLIKNNLYLSDKFTFKLDINSILHKLK